MYVSSSSDQSDGQHLPLAPFFSSYEFYSETKTNQLNLTSVFKWDLDLFTGDPAESVHRSDREHVRPANR